MNKISSIGNVCEYLWNLIKSCLFKLLWKTAGSFHRTPSWWSATSAAFPGTWAGIWIESEQLGLKQPQIWEVGILGSGLTHCATAPSPIMNNSWCSKLHGRWKRGERELCLSRVRNVPLKDTVQGISWRNGSQNTTLKNLAFGAQQSRLRFWLLHTRLGMSQQLSFSKPHALPEERE